MNSHSLTTAELLREEGSTFAMSVCGDCMEPVLRSGDKVTVEVCNFYRPGDIVVFRESSGRLVAHRLLGSTLTLHGWRYMTRPDRSCKIDGLLNARQILGRLSRNVSRNRKIHISVLQRAQYLVPLTGHSIGLVWRKLVQ